MLGTNLELPNNWPHQLIPGKTCHKCHAAKPLEDFHRNSRLEGGHEHQCKVCRSEKDRLRRISKHSNESTVADKACKKCQQIKPSQQFQRNAITADGLHSYCRSCKRIADMEARIRTKRKAQESQPDNVVRQYVRTPGSLTCSNCHHQQTDFVRQYPGTTIVCQQCATFVSLPAQADLQVWAKHCRGCNCNRSNSDFLPDQRSQDKLLSYCKKCLHEAKTARSTGSRGSSTEPHDPAAASVDQAAHSTPDPSSLGACVPPANTNKICPDCHESKPSEADFQWDKRCPNRQNLRCQPCQRAQKRKQRQAAAPERHVLVDNKICRRCQLDKPANEFPRKKEARDGIDCYCKLCHQKATADRVAKRGYVQHPAVSHKTCTSCRERQAASDFHRDVTKADGLRARCRGCKAQTGCSRRMARPLVTSPTVAEKMCRHCHVTMSAHNFCKKQQRQDGLDCYCKACNCKMTAAPNQRKQIVVESIATSRTCQRCEQEKPADEFLHLKCRSDALHSYCRSRKTETADLARLERASCETSEHQDHSPVDLLGFQS